jgi:hypothetical protein
LGKQKLTQNFDGRISKAPTSIAVKEMRGLKIVRKIPKVILILLIRVC